MSLQYLLGFFENLMNQLLAHSFEKANLLLSLMILIAFMLFLTIFVGVDAIELYLLCLWLTNSKYRSSKQQYGWSFFQQSYHITLSSETFCISLNIQFGLFLTHSLLKQNTWYPGLSVYRLLPNNPKFVDAVQDTVLQNFLCKFSNTPNAFLTGI